MFGNNKAKLDRQTPVMQQVSVLTSMGLIFMSLGISFGMIGMLSISREVGWAVFHAAGFMAVTPPLYIAMAFMGIALLLFTSGLVANMYERFFTPKQAVLVPVAPSHGVAGAQGVIDKAALGVGHAPTHTRTPEVTKTPHPAARASPSCTL